jgi:hypothetical protein
MTGLILIAGVISACLSLIALAGGLVMVFLSFVEVWTTENEPNDGGLFSSFCIAAACFYLGLASLFGLWVPAVSWIFVACLCVVGSFLAAVMVCFKEGNEELLTV